MAALRADSQGGTVQSGERVDNSSGTHAVVESDKGIRRCDRCGFQTRSAAEAEYHERSPFTNLVERVRKLERTKLLAETARIVGFAIIGTLFLSGPWIIDHFHPVVVWLAVALFFVAAFIGGWGIHQSQDAAVRLNKLSQVVDEESNLEGLRGPGTSAKNRQSD